MKWLRRLLWIFLGFFLLMMIVSQGAAWWWGRDVETLHHKSELYEFQAKRDEVSGAWSIQAPSETSLWFAFGYVQAWDREFQTDLVRLAARGEAARLFGESVLKNDRLMRFARRASEAEYAKSSPMVKSAAEAYIAGRAALLSDPERAEPIEYQIMGITRASLPAWEASDIVAVARFHSWQLSFDASLEQLYSKIDSKLGVKAARMLLPAESLEARALYSQPRLFDGTRPENVLRRNSNSPGLSLPKAFYPSPLQTSLESSTSQHQAQSSRGLSAWPLGKSIAFDWDTQLALRGASNLTVIADPRVGRDLTICNDTHLRFTWPSSLYPIRYEVAGVARGSGFMLPGVPAMVVGSFESLKQQQSGDALSWGITLASYGDTQDVILVDSARESSFISREENFEVRDLLTGELNTLSHTEEWTPWGPRVDKIFTENEGVDKDQIVALDWLGFRDSTSPLEFFVRRNVLGPEGLVEDLHERLNYPTFNFTWVSRNSGENPFIGHLVTGWLFERSRRDNSGLSPLRSGELASIRRELQPRDRRYFLREYPGVDPFFLATANQKIWTGKEGGGLAHSWEPGERAERIVATFDENTREPSFSQTDSYSPQLFKFVKSERKRMSVNRLCADSPLRSTQCVDLVAKFDAWTGSNEIDSWPTTLAALWHAHTKQEVFMALAKDDTAREALSEIAKDWHRRSYSSVALSAILRDPAEWEKATGRKFSDLSIEAFRKSLGVLVTARGPNPAMWGWGTVHRMDWMHPLVQAPEPWGTVFHDSMLGPRPGVPGALDSPGRFDYSWDASKPLEFPASHGAALRMCTEFSREGSLKMRWSAPSGPSGNPFSKYAKSWSFATFFKGLMSDIPRELAQ